MCVDNEVFKKNHGTYGAGRPRKKEGEEEEREEEEEEEGEDVCSGITWERQHPP